MNLFLIPLLPLLSFTILIFVGRRLGKFAPVVSLLALGGSALLSIQLFLNSGHGLVHMGWVWLPFSQQLFSFGLQADPLSITMCLVITCIGWLIMLYSIGYMHGDARFSRFFAYLSLFFCSMLTLVLADNFILLYIGWELVGLCSYLLISFWFEKPSAANAGKKAFLTTRVGDLGLLAAILLMGLLAGNLSFSGLEERAAQLGPWTGVIAVLIFWGAAGKSAQFPLHVWLPDAMEGPTPVSALIHAATMVAAGVYLVARTIPLFLPNPQALACVSAVAVMTSFFAATIACTQTDLKKILAYSTISQLGLMMLGLGAGSASAGMFHLLTHAWFKALLFLGAGSVIHAVHHQDITRMGGLYKKMPVTAITFTLASVAMAGVPPLSGFWSKEVILMAVHESLPPIFLVLGLSISLMTAFYITRAVLLTFFGAPRGEHVGHDRHREGHNIHESPLVMTGPLMVLAVGAAGVGLLGSPWTHEAFQKFLAGGHGAAHAAHHDLEWLQVASIGAAFTGILLAVARYAFGMALLPVKAREHLRPLYHLIDEKYHIDELYEAILLKPIRGLAKASFSFDGRVVDGAVNGAGELGLSMSRMKRWIDESIVDASVNGIAEIVGRVGAAFRKLQTGLVQNYLLLASFGAVGLYFLLRGMR